MPCDIALNPVEIIDKECAHIDAKNRPGNP